MTGKDPPVFMTSGEAESSSRRNVIWYFVSNMMAFLSNKAIDNRKKFAKQLRDAAAVTDFDSLRFLKAIHSMLAQMNSPCLRLELLQYMLGLDNRYSIAHVSRSVELAATCLSLSESEVFGDSRDMALLQKH
jgi:hypothetical protein